MGFSCACPALWTPVAGPINPHGPPPLVHGQDLGVARDMSSVMSSPSSNYSVFVSRTAPTIIRRKREREKIRQKDMSKCVTLYAKHFYTIAQFRTLQKHTSDGQQELRFLCGLDLLHQTDLFVSPAPSPINSPSFSLTHTHGGAAVVPSAGPRRLFLTHDESLLLCHFPFFPSLPLSQSRSFTPSQAATSVLPPLLSLLLSAGGRLLLIARHQLHLASIRGKEEEE